MCRDLVGILDDWILLGATEEIIRPSRQHCVEAMTAWGLKFKLHPTKGDGPTQSIEYVGCLVNLGSSFRTADDGW